MLVFGIYFPVSFLQHLEESGDISSILQAKKVRLGKYLPPSSQNVTGREPDIQVLCVRQ